MLPTHPYERPEPHQSTLWRTASITPRELWHRLGIRNIFFCIPRTFYHLANHPGSDSAQLGNVQNPSKKQISIAVVKKITSWMLFSYS